MYLILGFNVYVDMSIYLFLQNIGFFDVTSGLYNKVVVLNEDIYGGRLSIGNVFRNIRPELTYIFDIFTYMGVNFDSKIRNEEYLRSRMVEDLIKQGIDVIYPIYGMIRADNVVVPGSNGFLFPLNFHKPLFLFIDAQMKNYKPFIEICGDYSLICKKGIVSKFCGSDYTKFLLFSNSFRNYRIRCRDYRPIRDSFLGYVASVRGSGLMDGVKEEVSDYIKAIIRSLTKADREIEDYFHIYKGPVIDITALYGKEGSKYVEKLDYVEGDVVVDVSSPINHHLADAPLIGVYDGVNYLISNFRGNNRIVKFDKKKRNLTKPKRKDEGVSNNTKRVESVDNTSSKNEKKDIKDKRISVEGRSQREDLDRKSGKREKSVSKKSTQDKDRNGRKVIDSKKYVKKKKIVGEQFLTNDSSIQVLGSPEVRRVLTDLAQREMTMNSSGGIGSRFVKYVVNTGDPTMMKFKDKMVHLEMAQNSVVTYLSQSSYYKEKFSDNYDNVGEFIVSSGESDGIDKKFKIEK